MVEEENRICLTSRALLGIEESLLNFSERPTLFHLLLGLGWIMIGSRYCVYYLLHSLNITPNLWYLWHHDSLASLIARLAAARANL